nr:tRNA pseudouridine(55) synthase TruB [Rubrobacter taiwanensis]
MLDKPPGITSARAVSRVKRLLPAKTKVGHTGTLDPLASGLLVLAVGRATRLARYVTALDKTYTAAARFGAVSDTLDAEGEISELDVPPVDEDALRRAIPALTGEISQLPPMASAVKVGGRRLYELHRRGVEVEREPRRVTVYEFELTAFEPEEQRAEFHISCSSGTYVRSLIADLARSLGSGAYLTALRRTRVGHLSVEDAATPDELKTPADLQSRIIHMRAAVQHLPVVEIGSGLAAVVCGGGRFACNLEGSFRVESGGELLAVYRGDGKVARAEVVLWPR